MGCNCLENQFSSLADNHKWRALRRRWSNFNCHPSHVSPFRDSSPPVLSISRRSSLRKEGECVVNVGSLNVRNQFWCFHQGIKATTDRNSGSALQRTTTTTTTDNWNNLIWVYPSNGLMLPLAMCWRHVAVSRVPQCWTTLTKFFPKPPVRKIQTCAKTPWVRFFFRLPIVKTQSLGLKQLQTQSKHFSVSAAVG